MTPLSEHELIKAFVQVREYGPGDVVSVFSAMVRDARDATGRGLDTGVIDESKGRAGNWLGALGYLILLDQIGDCFQPSATTVRADKRALIRSLIYFGPDVDRRDRRTLYALRCAFAHDYALTNVRIREQGLTHRFLLNADTDSPLVGYPEREWNGKIQDESFGNETRVNLRKLGDVVESVVAEVQRKAEEDTLRVALGDGIVELQARFTLHIRSAAPEPSTRIIYARGLTPPWTATGTGTWDPGPDPSWDDA